ncbi:MAG: tetraacyldisaccharide 4'-kinase [Gammaproteobacteria bacterium]|nr:MAG: tetraacyldisaccharide 4'-kinase [Gammaproteobacteria bacterium]
MLSVALLPLSGIYCTLVMLHKALYRFGVKQVIGLAVPVVVVGNITVGGTGKTPLVIWIARFLQQCGYHPGVVARGYRGRSTTWPLRVHPQSDPLLSGDEPVLLARNTSCPVVVGPDRVRAARVLIDEDHCDVIVSDDGLQHYAMARDVEIVVIDGERRFGNGHCLPAGPLREPIRRLCSVSARVTNGEPQDGELGMQLRQIGFRRVDSPAVQKPLPAFAGQRVHAIAGIGNPQRFFSQLRALDIELVEHEYPDHHTFGAADIRFSDEAAVIMTEKDAVKCESFADERHWYAVVEARPVAELGNLVLSLLGQGATKGERPPDVGERDE